MSVTEIIVVRHAHRNHWIVDTIDGEYRAAQLNPTGIATDPALDQAGLEQSKQLAGYLAHLLQLDTTGKRIVIYSSPYYRCLQTIAPTISLLRADGWRDSVRVEAGFSEWFGTVAFDHLPPLDPAHLHARFLDFVHPTYQSQSVPSNGPEGYEELKTRVHTALASSILHAESTARSEARTEDKITLVIVCHSAAVVVLGRLLTNHCPQDITTDDFKCFLAGVSRYEKLPSEQKSRGVAPPRGDGSGHHTSDEQSQDRHPSPYGRWTIRDNSTCTHLSTGEEGGWHFGSNHVQDERIVRGPDGKRESTYSYTLQ